MLVPQNIVDAVVDPFVGAEFLLPGIFRENVDKITKNTKLKQLLTLGKLGRYIRQETSKKDKGY